MLLRNLFIICFLIVGRAGFSQLIDNFSDGNFTSNPVWLGSASDWAVNADFQLQSNNTTANSTFYISTASSLSQDVQWEGLIKLNFNTSSANYVDVYLTASQSDLTQTATTGYFLRLGGTDDEISLFRKDGNNTPVKIIDGVNGVLNSSNNTIRFKIIRSSQNGWLLLRDLSGLAQSFVQEGTSSDNTYTTCAFFGILIRQSTASFFQKHFFDDLVIAPYSPDLTPPAVVNANAVTNKTIEVLFNEPLQATTANEPTNYGYLSGGTTIRPVTAIQDAINTSLVTLTFANAFPNGILNTLTATNIKDVAGNVLVSGAARFSFYTPVRYDVVIQEIFADPTPIVALPNTEWVELRNASGSVINLQGFRIGKIDGTPSAAFPSFLLLPDSMVILTSTTGATLMSSFGSTLGVPSFPSLTNDGDVLMLMAPDGSLMHAVAYSSNWYKNAVKADGGWSIEMIDAKNACSGSSNWQASNDTKGGTPGKRNSVAAVNRDNEKPVLSSAAAISSTSINLFFNEPLDSVKAVLGTYSVSDGIGVATKVSAAPPLYNVITITLNAPLLQGRVYTITASGAADCAGNAMVNGQQVNVGLASVPDSLDLVVNEILFDPPSFGSDYVELYNRSSKIIDLTNVVFANRSSTTGAIGSLIPVSSSNRLLFPGGYVALTDAIPNVAANYFIKDAAALLQVSSMPSFPDDKGTVVLLNNAGKILDELKYDSRWHFALVDNQQGIALERIDPNAATQNANNWTSAAASAKFGTPGYINSQYRSDLQAKGTISVQPPLFSPDNDGFEDFVLIAFVFPEAGYVANITIMDAAGRVIRLLQRNTTCAATGAFRWDGLNDKLQQVAPGNYVIFTEIFNLKGQRKSYKNGITVAKKF